MGIRMRNILVIMIVISFLVFSCSSAKYKLEKKISGNNSFETAQKINKDGITGQLEGDKEDYYYFTVEDSTKIIDFYVSNSTYSPVIMTLYDYQTNIIKLISEPSTEKDNIKETNTNDISDDTNATVASNKNNAEDIIYSTESCAPTTCSVYARKVFCDIILS